MKSILFPIFIFVCCVCQSLSAQVDENPLDYLTEDDFKTGRYFEIIEEARIKKGETRKVQMVSVSAWQYVSEEKLKTGDFFQLIIQSPNHQVDTVFARVLPYPDRSGNSAETSSDPLPVMRDPALRPGSCSPVCEVTHEKCRKDH